MVVIVGDESGGGGAAPSRDDVAYLGAFDLSRGGEGTLDISLHIFNYSAQLIPLMTRSIPQKFSLNSEL